MTHRAVRLSTLRLSRNLAQLATLPDDRYDAYITGVRTSAPEFADTLNKLVIGVAAGWLKPAAPAAFGVGGPRLLQSGPEPTSNTGLPSAAGLSAGDAFAVLSFMNTLYNDVACPPGGNALGAVGKDIQLTALGQAMTRLSPASAAIWFAVQGGGFVAKRIQESAIAAGFDAYEKARAAFFESGYAKARGLTPDQPLSREDRDALRHAIQEDEFFRRSGQALEMALAYLSTGTAIGHFNNLTPDQWSRGLAALEFAHYQNLLQQNAKKGQGPIARFFDYVKGLAGGPPIPGKSDLCGENPANIVAGYDPNDIAVDPAGAPDEGWISAQPGRLRYVIHFENLPKATAAAEDIRVTTTLDPALDTETLEFGETSFAGTRFAFDPATRVVTFLLPGINLPPNTAPPLGEGFVTFSAVPKAGLASGVKIRQSAQVFFDFNPPIATPVALNTLDAEPPVSAVAAPGPTIHPRFRISWSGSDAQSGIQDYSIYVSENGGPLRAWLTNTTLTSALFDGADLKQYRFWSTARDRAGNVEKLGAAPDVVFTAPPEPISNLLFDVNGDSKVDLRDATLVLKAGVGLLALAPNQKAVLPGGGFATPTLKIATQTLLTAVGLRPVQLLEASP